MMKIKRDANSTENYRELKQIEKKIGKLESRVLLEKRTYSQIWHSMCDVCTRTLYNGIYVQLEHERKSETRKKNTQQYKCRSLNMEKPGRLKALSYVHSSTKSQKKCTYTQSKNTPKQIERQKEKKGNSSSSSRQLAIAPPQKSLFVSQESMKKNCLLDLR